MNLYQELSRLTEPDPKAGKVRALSKEEIEVLQEAGAITPVELIPEAHMPRRVSLPPAYKLSRYRYGR